MKLILKHPIIASLIMGLLSGIISSLPNHYPSLLPQMPHTIAIGLEGNDSGASWFPGMVFGIALVVALTASGAMWGKYNLSQRLKRSIFFVVLSAIIYFVAHFSAAHPGTPIIFIPIASIIGTSLLVLLLRKNGVIINGKIIRWWGVVAGIISAVLYYVVGALQMGLAFGEVFPRMDWDPPQWGVTAIIVSWQIIMMVIFVRFSSTSEQSSESQAKNRDVSFSNS